MVLDKRSFLLQTYYTVTNGVRLFLARKIIILINACAYKSKIPTQGLIKFTT